MILKVKHNTTTYEVAQYCLLWPGKITKQGSEELTLFEAFNSRLTQCGLNFWRNQVYTKFKWRYGTAAIRKLTEPYWHNLTACFCSFCFQSDSITLVALTQNNWWQRARIVGQSRFKEVFQCLDSQKQIGEIGCNGNNTDSAWRVITKQKLRSVTFFSYTFSFCLKFVAILAVCFVNKN